MRMRRKKDIEKVALYESVKAILDNPSPHIHLPQHKLYTLFSIAFQYFLFKSMKEKGNYVIRIEDHQLASKIVKKAKDESTRNFMERLIFPRKLNYAGSTFYIDFFHLNSWGLVNELPRNSIKGALIVKGSKEGPFQIEEADTPMAAENGSDQEALTDEGSLEAQLPQFPPKYFYQSLQDFIPKTIVIAYNEDFPDTSKMNFEFIQKSLEEKPLQGVKLASDVDIFEED